MRRKTGGRPRALAAALVLILLVGTLGGWLALAALRDRSAYLDLPRAAVERRDLEPVLGSGGSLDAGEKTIVRCELESHTVGAAGSAIILDLAEDGAVVAKDQVIARLDASRYEELVRQDEILLLQARAEAQKAELDLESAEIALREYRDGQLEQLRQEYRGQIVLQEANIRRQRDRLAWAAKMVVQNYLSAGQLADERTILNRSEVALARARGELRTLEDFAAEVQVRRLEAAVARAREELSFQRLQVRNREDQLANARERVEACTIRAPHAGMINYVSKWDPNIQLEAGAMAFQNMPLFYFPNLETLEVTIELHESMFGRVRAGQPARIVVATRPGLRLEGRVKSVDPLPVPPNNWWMSDEIRNFTVRVAVLAPPPGLYPGMSASVEILGDRRVRALVVPSTAVTGDDDDSDAVYVVGKRGLERRAVEVRPGDRRVVEVLSGLAEGEEVILDPAALDPAELRAARPTAGPAPGGSLSALDRPGQAVQ